MHALIAALEPLLDASSDPGKTLEAALDRCLSRFGCVTGTVHRWDPGPARLELLAQRGIPAAVLERIGSIPLGKGMAGIAAERRAPVQVCNLQTDDSGVVRPGARETRMAGSIAVPLLADGNLVGTLGIAKAEPYDFPEAEVEELEEGARLLARFLAARA